ncbi:hypothetical protein [Pseudophaeobacter sp. TrK17]|jgi:DNA adenine methylase|uniref:hypothetical protein n=1 Tax=Pseudophaeobacter sp. TrK17 TaxID=2815167 RepID=UPI0035D0C6B4
MAEQLGAIRGKFILSINDCPEIRALFAGFEFEQVRLKYTVAAGGATEATELIISNFEPRIGLI